MTFKWKNKDEELPMSIERADDTKHPFQWGTLWFGVSLGMVLFLALSVAITIAFPTFP